ncbi:MAG: GIY-YIG nuclease family protein [Caulobacteraceae bacterium]
MVEHKAHRLGGFTARYGVDALVWYETHPTRQSAWTREKQMKSWRRSWKLTLIERGNPQWRDLFPELAPVASSLRSHLSVDPPA